MYKKVLLVLIVLLSFDLAAQEENPCGEINKQIVQDLLGESVYDNFRRTEIKTAENPYDLEFRVDLLRNFVYKLVFDMKDKSEGAVVKLYDLGPKKKKEDPNPKLIYSSLEDKMDENAMFEITFEAPKTRMLVRYEVKDATYPGCVTFMLGVFMQGYKSDSKNINYTDFKK